MVPAGAQRGRGGLEKLFEFFFILRKGDETGELVFFLSSALARPLKTKLNSNSNPSPGR